MTLLARAGTSTTALILMMGLSACGDSSNDSSLKRAWDSANRPQNIDPVYQLTLQALPTHGTVKDRLWSDSYWPSSEGGIAKRWRSDGRPAYPLLSRAALDQLDIAALSPAEKYDIYLGRYDFPLTQAELKRTRITYTLPNHSDYRPGYSIANWEGLCHAWAPAAYLFQEPGPVTVTNSEGIKISFASSDIKALLMRMMNDDVYNRSQPTSRAYSMGQRCELDFAQLRNKLARGEISQGDFNNLVDNGACEDTNAGAFHVALANRVGLMNKSFVIDVTRDYQVWNQPIHSYTTQLRELSGGISRNAAPGTVRIVEANTRLLYVFETNPRWEGQTAGNNGLLREVNYRYHLEINNQGEIIGGEWLSSERPDIAWTQTKPQFTGYFAELAQLYQQATGDTNVSTETPTPSTPSTPSIPTTPTSPGSNPAPGTGAWPNVFPGVRDPWTAGHTAGSNSGSSRNPWLVTPANPSSGSRPGSGTSPW